MERKLVKQGRNALTITPPAAWLKEQRLNAGDSVFLEENNQQITIKSERLRPKEEITIDVKDCERGLIYHQILAKYIEGYDTIIVLHNNPTLLQEVIESLLGMIIEEHTPTRTVFRSIIAVPEENFSAVLRRATFILLQQARTLLAITEKKAALEQLKAEEKLLDYNILYCLRYLNKYEDKKHAYRYFLLCSTIEQAGDHLSTLGKEIGNNKELAQNINRIINDYISFLFKQDLEKVYTTLKSFRKSLPKKTFQEGIAFALAESLYNYLGYIIGDHKTTE